MRDDDHFAMDRRTVLKRSGIALATLGGTVGTATAQDQPSVIDRAYRVFDETNSHEAWRRYLGDNGYDVTTKRAMFGMPRKDELAEEGVSSLRYYEDNLDISIALGAPSYRNENYHASLSWNYNPSASDRIAYGQAPQDCCGIGFVENEWELASNDLDAVTQSSEYVSHRSNSATGEGMTFDVEDRNIDKYTDEDESWHYAGIDIYPEEDHDPSERHVQGGYTFTWRTICPGGISAALPDPGFGLSVTTCVKQERTITGDNNERLRVYQDDA